MKRSLSQRYRSMITSMFFMLLLISCHEDIEDPVYIEDKVKTAILESMREWYFWNEELPVSLDQSQYGSYHEFLDALRFKSLDRWSYITTREAFNNAFTGRNIGHGFGWGLDTEENLFISFVYDDSPAGEDGWQRGWQVVEINDRPVASYKTGNGYNFDLGPSQLGFENTFTLQLPDGSTTRRTIAKTVYQSNSVLYQNVYETAAHKVGYWVYNSFKATAGISPTQSKEVSASLNYFRAENIDELIIDLRYNGGGSVAVAEQMLNALVPRSADGKTMYTNELNTDKSKFNDKTVFQVEKSLGLERIIFITSRGSASASELIINCLTPYMEVVLIGDNTYGKPVGAFPLSRYHRALQLNDVELVPITFATANADGKAAYFDGFPVDFSVSDDLSKNWGDLEEDRFQAALEYIRNGLVSPSGRKIFHRPSWEMIDGFEGLEKEFPVY